MPPVLSTPDLVAQYMPSRWSGVLRSRRVKLATPIEVPSALPTTIRTDTTQKESETRARWLRGAIRARVPR